jgi:hypothetical protein
MIWFVIFCFLFYSLNITGFKIKNFVLAKSCLIDEPIDLVFWVPYAASVVTFIFAPSVGQWMLLGVFIFFHIVCFLLHINTGFGQAMKRHQATIVTFLKPITFLR